MSTDMAISLSKKFIRQISQPFDHTQTGISLWTLEDIEERQKKDEEEKERLFTGRVKKSLVVVKKSGSNGVVRKPVLGRRRLGGL